MYESTEEIEPADLNKKIDEQLAYWRQTLWLAGDWPSRIVLSPAYARFLEVHLARTWRKEHGDDETYLVPTHLREFPVEIDLLQEEEMTAIGGGEMPPKFRALYEEALRTVGTPDG